MRDEERERAKESAEVENCFFFMWMRSCRWTKKKNPDNVKNGAIIHMSTIYIFLIFWRLTKQQYLSISGVCLWCVSVFVCCWDVIFPYAMQHIDDVTTQPPGHGTYLHHCLYVYNMEFRFVRSFVQPFLFLSTNYERTHQFTWCWNSFSVFSFEQCTRNINTFDNVNGKQWNWRHIVELGATTYTTTKGNVHSEPHKPKAYRIKLFFWRKNGKK